MTLTQTLDAQSRAEYQREDRALRLRYSKITYLVAMGLIPAASFLDRFVYPELVGTFFRYRLIAALVLGLCLALHYTAMGARWVRLLNVAWVLLINGFLSFLIYLAEGPASPYYAGLNLVLLGVGVFLPLTTRETFGVSLATAAFYTAACGAHTLRPEVTTHWQPFFNNMFFLFSTFLICVVSAHFTSQARVRDFVQRHELDTQNRKLQELDRLKSDFFANISHELRTPLTLILSPIDDLLHRGAPLEQRVRAALDIARQNGLRLMRLINDLLEMVRLESGRFDLHRESINLSEFVPGIVESVRHLGEAKGLSIQSEGPTDALNLDADRSRMEKVLINLMTNAIKFTEAGSVCARWWRENNRAMIEVRDTGIGIPEQELPHVFDRFRQVDSSSTRRFQGVGLGLALARELVEEHGGTMTVSSQLGRGTAFRVELPITASAAMPAMPGKTTPNTPDLTDPIARTMRDASTADIALGASISDSPDTAEVGTGAARVLVVDDEPDMRRFLVSLLTDNYRVIQAKDGPSGLEKAQRDKPDLMLLDMMLPGMTGTQVCSALKHDDATKDIKIILLTARADEQTKIDALEQGADDFLTKPFSSIEVITRLRNLYRTSSLQRDLRERNVELEQTLARLRSTEAQLIQSEKMNALGSMAAGLLHEINNPLNFTLTAIQLAVETTDPQDEDLRDTLNDIEDGMKRIRDIVISLRSFAYPEEAQKQERFDLAGAIDTAMKFTAHAHQECSIEIDVDPIMILGSKSHVIQVLVNLITNAIKAVESLGADHKPHIRIAATRRQDRTLIQVEDNGAGIDPAVLPRIFDPFFTTRDVGQGMGLGLSVCHTIVQNHGGTIRAESQPGRGTTVSFDLPMVVSEITTHV